MFSRGHSIRWAVAVIVSVAPLALYAQNVHFVKGPTCEDLGLTASCNGKLSGLGEGDVVVNLEFPNATATTTCTSPGGNEAPGQNPAVPVDVQGTVELQAAKNGTLTFTVTTEPPADPTPEEADCANKNWTAAIDTISFGTGTLTVVQGGETVLTTQVVLP
jgi:hypothetical protein